MLRATCPRRCARRGNTLLEVILASTLMAVTLVPGLRMMRDCMSAGRRVDRLGLLRVYGVSKLEEHLAMTAANWAEVDASGDFAADGYANLHFHVVASQQLADGGIPDQLMVVTATVWDDADNDGALDGGEANEIYSSKVARMANYINGN